LGIGRRLGQALAAWVERGDGGLENGVALGNRFVDLLGSDTFLSGAVRDLARRPLFQQALRSQGLARRSALRVLAGDLASTYAPAVLAELLDLLEAGLGEGDLRPPPGQAGEVARPLPQGIPAESPLAIAPPAPAPQAGLVRRPRAALVARELRPLLPGLGFAALMVAVLAWLAEVVDRQWLRPGQASAGLVLALLPLLVPLFTGGPLRRWRGAGLLTQAASGDPHQLWRWVTAPWLHRRRGEALLHALLLALILGPSPLPLDALVLRYGLTSLACLALAALTARWLGLRQQEWGGAAGAVGALLGLAVGLSLLHRRELGFPLGEVTVPAWVLLVVASSLQLAWILPRRDPDDPTRPLERLLTSLWWWGLVLGVVWAGISGGMELVAPLLRARPA
jgi:membrane associated rhomboid family serine protease